MASRFGAAVPLSTRAERISRRMLSEAASGVERWAAVLVAIWAAGILALGVLKALYKPLWLDELLEAYVTRLPRISEIWAVSHSGADGQPPAYHYLTWTSARLFDNTALGIRIPSLIGYVVCGLCLYWFVTRLSSRLYGLVAMLFPCITGAWYYATEGRPYGILLGCAGVAAVCWQSIAMNKSRGRALAGLFLSLACAISVHYCAPALIAPFAAAELVRTYRLKRVDWAVWIAVFGSGVVFLPYLPLIKPLHVNLGTPPFFELPAWWGSLTETTTFFLSPALPTLVAVACLYIAYRAVASLATPAIRPPVLFPQALPEGFLAIVLACIPIFVLFLAKFVTHVYFPRYTIAFVAGVAIIFAMGAWIGFDGRREPALLTLLLIAGAFAHTGLWDFRNAEQLRADPIGARTERRLPPSARNDDLPVVAGKLGTFMELSYYGSPRLLKRLVYLSSEQLGKQLAGFTNGERLAIAGSRAFGTHVVDYHDFVKTHRDFYVVGDSDWLLEKLIEDGAQVALIRAGVLGQLRNGLDPVVLVHYPS